MTQVIAVKVVKEFEAIRTPCPPIGTVGECYRLDDEYVAVRFPLPMTDTEGAEWISQGEDTDFMKLLFAYDEVELL